VYIYVCIYAVDFISDKLKQGDMTLEYTKFTACISIITRVWRNPAPCRVWGGDILHIADKSHNRRQAKDSALQLADVTAHGRFDSVQTFSMGDSGKLFW
jgi:hypothetical protein